MADHTTASANDEDVGGAKLAIRRKLDRASDEQRSRSDERRVLDALEDDDVREALRTRHERES